MQKSTRVLAGAALLSVGAAVGMLFAAPSPALNQVPFIFQDGTVASASEVNENFRFLDEDRIVPLETTIVDLTGAANIRNGSILTADLANDSVTAAKTREEAGVANTNTDSFSFTGGVETILSRTISVPSDGFVFAIASCQANAFHANGTTDNSSWGVSDTAGVLPTTQDVGYFINSTYPSGNFLIPVTVHGIFPVTAGDREFFFLGQQISGSFSANDINFSLMYFPTAYGTVVPPSPGGPDSDLDAYADPAD